MGRGMLTKADRDYAVGLSRAFAGAVERDLVEHDLRDAGMIGRARKVTCCTSFKAIDNEETGRSA